MVIQSKIPLLLYKTLILDYGITAAKEIFENVSLVQNNRTISAKEIFTLLYSDTHVSIPLKYVLQIYNTIERFLDSHSYSKDQFIRSLLDKTPLSITTSEEMLLRAFEPYLGELYTCSDPRNFLIDRVDILYKLCIPMSNMKKVHQYQDNCSVISFMELSYSYQDYHHYSYNVELWTGKFLKASPLCLGAPEFDSVHILGDCRTIEDILGEVSVENGIVSYNGEHIGVCTFYGDFLQDLGIDISNCSGNPEVIGIVSVVDVYKEGDSTPQIRKGCFYGASSNLLRISFVPVELDTTRALKEIVKELDPPSTHMEPLFAQRHEDLLSQYLKRVDVSFNTVKKKIYLNDKPFARGFPACLLFYICTEIEEGRTSPFQYVELIQSPYFSGILDPCLPNLNVRISRLKERLEEKFPLWQIKPAGKGAFHFITHVEYSVNLR